MIEPLLIMMLVLVEVALWQWRVAITVRGRVVGGAVLGFTGAVVQVTAISRVVQDVGNVVTICGYAVGVAVGVALGCLIDRHVSDAQVSVRVVAPADPELVPALRVRGWPLTATTGQGHNGPVEVLYLAVDRRRAPSLERDLRALAPDACWTIERIATSRGLLAVGS